MTDYALTSIISCTKYKIKLHALWASIVSFFCKGGSKKIGINLAINLVDSL